MLEHKTKKVQYLDKDFAKVDANFVEIESLYGKYESPFFSKSKLHKYLKEDCTSLV